MSDQSLFLRATTPSFNQRNEPVFSYLKKHYCRSVIDRCNLLVNTQNKSCNLSLMKDFLSNCLTKKIIPKWLWFRIKNSKLKPGLAIERVFLKNELGQIDIKWTKLQNYEANILCFLEENLSNDDLTKLKKFTAMTTEKLVERKKKANSQELNRLISKRYGTLPSRKITNLSTYKLTEEEEFTLCLGLNFSLPPARSDREDIFAGFEMFYNQIRKHKPVDSIKGKAFKANLLSCAHGYSVNYKETGFELDAKEIRKTVRLLKQNKAIVITKPDKGSGTVVLDHSDYVRKMRNIIDDTTKFKHLGASEKCDKTTKHEDILRKFLKDLKGKGELSKHNFELIWPIGSQCPRLYGLPKTHKRDIPLRPILSLVGSAQHKLAKFLNFLLEPVTRKFSQYTVQDSFTFVDMIRKTPAKDTYMVSFDVKSLFTNVPLEETIEICANELYNNNSNIKLSKSNFIKLMYMATSGIEFCFDGQMYSQVDGVVMGSPLGPTLANIIMGHLEAEFFNKNDFPLMYCRYVDDCFLLFHNKNDCDRMFRDFNCLHPSIQFTMEAEDNNKLAFLDVLIQRNNNEFLTSIYRKTTFTGEYINFHSYCSRRRKTNLIRTLVDRAMKICSSELLQTELDNISTILEGNGFPKQLVFNTMQRRMDENKSPKIGPQLDAIPLKLPFLGEKSYTMEKHIKSSVRQCYNSASARIIFSSKPNFTPANKDPIPLFNKSFVVYHFRCHCGNDYIGQTARRFVVRLNEHVPKCVRTFLANPIGAYRNDKQLVNAAKKSSIAKHLLNNHKECGKHYEDSMFKIIRNCKSDYQLKVTEAVLISTLEPTLCVQQEFDYVTVLI